MAKQTGKGSKFYASSTGVFVDADIIGNLTSIGEIGSEFSEVNVTDLDSNGIVEVISGEEDYGSQDLEGYVNSGNYAKLKALKGKTAHFAMATPGLAEGNIQYTGFISSLKFGARTANEAISFTATVRISGEPTDFTPPTPEPSED